MRRSGDSPISGFVQSIGGGCERSRFWTELSALGPLEPPAALAGGPKPPPNPRFESLEPESKPVQPAVESNPSAYPRTEPLRSIPSPYAAHLTLTRRPVDHRLDAATMRLRRK